MPLDIAEIIGKRLNLPRKQVASTLRLLDDGATIPFIARYRKEMTGSLDEVALNNIRTQAEELEELEKRKEFVADAIEKSGAMTDDLMIRLAATLDPAEVGYISAFQAASAHSCRGCAPVRPGAVGQADHEPAYGRCGIGGYAICRR